MKKAALSLVLPLLCFQLSFSQNLHDSVKTYSFQEQQDIKTKIKSWINTQKITYSFQDYPKEYLETNDNSPVIFTRKNVLDYLFTQNIVFDFVSPNEISINLGSLIDYRGFYNPNNQTEPTIGLFKLTCEKEKEYISFELLEGGFIKNVRATVSLLLKYSFVLEKGAEKTIVELLGEKNEQYMQVGWDNGLKYYFYDDDILNPKNAPIANVERDTSIQKINTKPNLGLPASIISKTYRIKYTISADSVFKHKEEIYLDLHDSLLIILIEKYGRDTVKSLSSNPIQFVIGPKRGMLTKNHKNIYWEKLELSLFEILPKMKTITLTGFTDGDYVDISPKTLDENVFKDRSTSIDSDKLLSELLLDFGKNTFLDICKECALKLPRIKAIQKD